MGDPRARPHGREAGNPLKAWFPGVGASEVVGNSVPANARQVPMSVPPAGVQLPLPPANIPSGVYLPGPIFPPNLQMPEDLPPMHLSIDGPRENPLAVPFNATHAGPIPVDTRNMPPVKHEALMGPPAPATGPPGNSDAGGGRRPPPAPVQAVTYLVTPLKTAGPAEVAGSKSMAVSKPASKVRPGLGAEEVAGA